MMPRSLHILRYVAVVTVAAFTAAFAQTSGNFNMDFLGSLDPRPTTGGGWSYSACWGYTAQNGREYAFLGAYEGTSIIDITDSTNITEVAFIPGPNTSWREMKTYQQYAYIVSESIDLASGAGVQIVDLSALPNSATLVNTYVWVDTAVSQMGDTTIINRPAVHSVSIDGKYLYLNGGFSYNGMRILDLTDPLNPVKAGVYDSLYVHDSYIRNDTVYASAIYSGGGLDIIDASDKSNLQRIHLLQYPGSGTHNAWVTDDGNYVLTTDEINPTNKSLKIWNISSLPDVSYVTEVNFPSAIVHNVFIKDTLAYVAWYKDGIRVVNISDPTQPQVVGQYDTYPYTPDNDPSPFSGYNGVWGAFPYYPSGKVIVSDMLSGLYVFRYNPGSTSPPPPPPDVPTPFVLHQNYPNPFNGETIVQFELPNETFVHVRLLNLLGQELRVLQYGRLPASSYEFRVDASGLSSGIYILRVETIEFSKSIRMVLVK